MNFLIIFSNPFLMFYSNKLQILFGAILAASAANANEIHFNQNPPAGLQVICPANQIFATSGPNCTATFALPTAQAINNGCNGAITLTYSSEMGAGVGPFWDVPMGSQQVHVKAVNACGEEATCVFTATVKDQKKPTATVVKELFANLTGNGSATFKARVFDLGSTDNCSQKSALRFAFSQNPADSVRMFDCDSIGSRSVKIFVIDESGNMTVKNSTVHISDANEACQLVFATGKITNEAGQPVENVQIDLLAGGDFSADETDETGGFHFEKIHAGQAVTIKPTKDVNPMNGVSTLDLSLISRHILGQKPLGSPLKIIAADINRNGQVTTGDLVQLRKTILGEYLDFPQNDSWRFVPKSHVFANPAMPLSTQFPEEAAFSELTNSQLNLDFWGIKTGDVNGDAVANNFNNPSSDDRSGNDLFLKINDRNFRRGELVEVIFQTDFSVASGLQTTLEFDQNALIFNELNENSTTDFTEKNISTARLADGKLPISWFAKTGETAAENNLFSVKFRAAADGKLSETLRLGNFPTTTTAFDGDGLTYNLKLIFEDGQAQEDEPAPRLSLAQNEPNPAVGETKIRFSLPENGPATLRLFDPMGREVWQTSGDFGAGDNEFRFDASALGLPGGLYIYRLDAPSGSLAHKLDLIFR